MSESRGNESQENQSSFKTAFRDREKGEKPQNYYQSVLLNNSLEAVKKSGIEITPALILNLGKLAFEFGEITGNNEEISLIDSLTGLYNRHGFKAELKKFSIKETGRLERRKEKQILPISLVYLDIDNFKFLNDTYGHDAGDELLRLLAKSMQENKRENDVLVRWGGDEFILLCLGTTKEAAQKIMERVGLGIKELMEESFPNLEKPLGFTFSLEEWNQKKEDFFAFIKRVDQKLVELKKQKHV